jgi:hypothetical protein
MNPMNNLTWLYATRPTLIWSRYLNWKELSGPSLEKEIKLYVAQVSLFNLEEPTQ